MKAELTKDGCLVIEAEESIEQYALNLWFKDFTSEDTENRSVTLRIDTESMDLTRPINADNT